MDSSEARLDAIELQRSTHDTESVPEFLANVRLSDLYNFPGESVVMTSEIFSTIRDGNKEIIEKMKSYETPMACYKNEKGDSILHVASSFGHLELVESIVSECPSLLLEHNWEDRIPLHTAARAGHSAIVKVLVASIAFFYARLSGDEDKERLNVYAIKDINGDTPLHLALKDLQEKTELLMEQHIKKQGSLPHPIMYWRRSRISKSLYKSFHGESTRLLETAICLVSAKRCVSFFENKDGISPLYLAVKAGNLFLVYAMLSRPGNSVEAKSSNFALEGRKSLVHAALKANNIDILDVILNEYPSLVNERDEDGQTCLSIGASLGCYEGICKLLDLSTSSIFDCNDDGSFPIHKAVEKGHLNVVKELLERCPASIEQLNKDGQNVLHIAAKSGNLASFLMCYIEKVGTKNHLMKEQDVDGNTPLHLATIKWRPRTVNILTYFDSTKTKVLDIQNKDGLRPLDIAEKELQSDYVFRERMTLMVLLCIYKPKGVSWVPTSGMTLRSISDQSLGGEKFKDRVNVLLLMAALVATMTFAAGFTMPGGFNSSAPNIGMAILVRDQTLSAFLVCDTLAMQSSLIARVALIWAQLGDQELAHRAFHLALPSLFFSLCCMSLAFIYGVQATIKENGLLKALIIIISVILTDVMIILLTPYVIPQLHGISSLQFVSDMYLALLLRLNNEDYTKKPYTSGSSHTRPGSLCCCSK